MLFVSSVTEGFRVNSDENMGTYSCTLDILSGVNNRRSLSSCSIYNGQTSGAVTASSKEIKTLQIESFSMNSFLRSRR